MSDDKLHLDSTVTLYGHPVGEPDESGDMIIHICTASTGGNFCSICGDRLCLKVYIEPRKPNEH